jgi:hypothetical protein
MIQSSTAQWDTQMLSTCQTIFYGHSGKFCLIHYKYLYASYICRQFLAKTIRNWHKNHIISRNMSYQTKTGQWDSHIWWLTQPNRDIKSSSSSSGSSPSVSDLHLPGMVVVCVLEFNARGKICVGKHVFWLCSGLSPKMESVMWQYVNYQISIFPDSLCLGAIKYRIFVVFCNY